jgi:hypothetical protein
MAVRQRCTHASPGRCPSLTRPHTALPMACPLNCPSLPAEAATQSCSHSLGGWALSLASAHRLLLRSCGLQCGRRRCSCCISSPTVACSSCCGSRLLLFSRASAQTAVAMARLLS